MSSTSSAFRSLVLSLLLTTFCGADCIPFTEAGKHIGEIHCVTGKVFRVEHGDRGVTYFDFCENYRTCPFTAIVFRRDLKSVGDVRQLQGRTIEIHGPVKEYDGRAEIIVEEARQLGGEASRIPPLPKNYDVEEKGHYSAGKFSLPKPKRAKSKKKQPVTLPIEIPDEPTE